jgi:HAD superfamily hydrolase (TIGR01509 family)
VTAGAVLLDLDDTLMADDDAVNAALAAAWSGVAPDPAEAAALVRAEARALWRVAPHYHALRDLGISSWEVLWADLTEPTPWAPALRTWADEYRREAWRRSLAALHLDQSSAEALSNRFRQERRARCTPYPGVIPLLAGLRRRASIAVVTNGMPELQRFKAHEAGIADLVDTMVVSADVGAAKPDPRGFHTALARLRAVPEDAVMVGDSLARDVAGAAATGMRTVWVNAGRQRPDDGVRPTAVIEHVSLLPAALDDLA